KQKPVSSSLRHSGDAAAFVARTNVASESKPKSVGTEPPPNHESQGDNPLPHRYSAPQRIHYCDESRRVHCVVRIALRILPVGSHGRT
ncbi:MAG: hypothetical protein KDA91_25395, partial [Planctomycetaceae bacterium]|nr:hypothetical protein [Planctomycetaceae bacterium]